jgi:uncharacterized protein
MIRKSQFQPAPGLHHAHLQTLFAALLRPSPRLSLRRERFELPDGDFVDLDWSETGTRPGAPLVILLHGLTGSIRSKYIRGLMRQLNTHGWRAVLMHFRGASEEPNRLPRGYHSGDTDDVNDLVRELYQREGGVPMAVVGFSLGGNVLLKWLGEQGGSLPIRTAVAVSVPFDLHQCALAIRQGFSRIYMNRLLREMRARLRQKFNTMQPPFTLPDLDELRDFIQYDDAIIAPLHGFANAQDYYAHCSSRFYLKHIRIPTLVLHAIDDPFMCPEVVPQADDLSDAVTLELSTHGGHVGFVSSTRTGKPVFWLESRIPQHLAPYLTA